jgi:type I protein arginine methyltransferase
LFLHPTPTHAHRERFAGEAQEHYGVDVGCLTKAYREEQTLYYSKTAAWADVNPDDLLGNGQVVASMDLAEIGLEESKKPLKAEVDLLIEGGEDTTCDAVVGYFDVSFRGGKGKQSSTSSSSSTSPSPTDAPATEPVVTLSTEPCAEGATHWGQQVFPLSPPLPVRSGDRVTGSVVIRRRKDNPRLLEVELDVRVVEGPLKGAVAADGALKGRRKEHYQVE